jgi:tetratricopeptide (TPR) repeat protein
MRYPAKLLSLIVLTTLLSALYNSRSETEAKTLYQGIVHTKQAHGSITMLLKTEGALEEGDSTLDDGSLYDTHTVEGKAGQTIAITLESSDFDTFLVLLDDEGREVARNDDINTEAGNYHSFIVVTLPSDGVYTIWANGFDSSSRGRYILTIVETSPEQAVPSLSEVALAEAEADRLLQRGSEQLNADLLPESAIESFKEALSVYQTLGDQESQAIALVGLISAYRLLSDFHQMIEYAEQALQLYRTVDSREGQAFSLSSLADAHLSLGNNQQAIVFSEQSLEQYRNIGDISGQSLALLALGNAAARMSNFHLAIDYFEQAFQLSEADDDQPGQLGAFVGLGEVLQAMGEFYPAIVSYEAALQISEAIGTSNHDLIYSIGTAAIHQALGSLHYQIGSYQQSIDHYETAQELYAITSNKQGQAYAFVGLGSAYYGLGDYPQSIAHNEQALQLTKEIEDLSGQADALANLGINYLALGDVHESLDYSERASQLYENLENSFGQANTLMNVGIVYWILEEHQRAIELYEQSLVISRRINYRIGEADALYNQAAVLVEINRVLEAESLLRSSIEIYESLRTGLPDSQLISIADLQAKAYANLERVLVAQDNNFEALAITERGRGRAFVLQLASRLANEEERAALEASSVDQVPSVAEIQQIARDTNTTLVTYSLIFDQALFIWVVQPSGDIDFRSVQFDGSGEGALAINPISSIDGPVYRSATPDSAITALVTDSRSAVNESGNPNTPQLQELHEILIDPISDFLPSDPNAQVAFIPQGELFLVPFAALQDTDGTYLIEKHTILTAPSIQVFELASEAGSLRLRSESEDNRFLSGVEGNALVVGNPTMPTVWLPTDDGLAETQLSYLSGAETEAKAIGDFFNIPVLTGEQATEARIKQELPNASLIHLATHGLLEYGIPESSGVLDVPGAVALAPGNGEDGLLTSAEILQMDLQADLVLGGRNDPSIYETKGLPV